MCLGFYKCGVGFTMHFYIWAVVVLQFSSLGFFQGQFLWCVYYYWLFFVLPFSHGGLSGYRKSFDSSRTIQLRCGPRHARVQQCAAVPVVFRHSARALAFQGQLVVGPFLIRSVWWLGLASCGFSFWHSCPLHVLGSSGCSIWMCLVQQQCWLPSFVQCILVSANASWC